MATQSLAPIVAEIRSFLEAADREEPGVLADLRNGHSPIRFSSVAQWFATWDSVQGILRDFSMHMALPAVRLLRDPDFPREAIAPTVSAFVAPNARFLSQFGFPEIIRWAEAIAASDPADPDFDTALAGLARYANRLHSWSFHYFPWEIAERAGFKLPQQRAEESSHAVTAVSRSAKVIPTGDFIRIGFPDLGKSVRAWLASDANPELVADVKDALPFTTFIDHASVAGESMFAWAPMVSTAPLRMTERVCDAPRGRIRFSQNTGQKFTIQYGETHETIHVAVLGSVVDEDVETLREIGAAVRHATTVTKDLVWMTVEAE